MPTSLDIDMHFWAKKAKNRLSGHSEEKNCEYNKHLQRENELYNMILEMATQEQTVYNPISRFLGKDLSKVPDSCEKTRIVLETSHQVENIRQRVKFDLIKMARRNEFVVIDGKEYEPLELLRKLH